MKCSVCKGSGKSLKELIKEFPEQVETLIDFGYKMSNAFCEECFWK